MEEKNYHVIGFTEQYYTLWNIIVAPIYGQNSHTGQIYVSSIKTHYIYIQNLSMDKDSAIEKFKQKYPNEKVQIDEDLRGLTRSWHSIKKVDNVPTNQLVAGKYRGHTFEDLIIENMQYLVWAYNENACLKLYNVHEDSDCSDERKERLKVILADNAIYDKDSDKFYTSEEWERIKRNNYLNSCKSGYYFNDGEKVELELTMLREGSFEGVFGRAYIQTFVDGEGRLFKYMGSAPLNVEQGKKFKVKATINHKFNNYDNVEETRLKRPKLI